MKNYFLLMAIAAILCASCQKYVFDDESADSGKKKNVTFKVKGNFELLQSRANAPMMAATQVSASQMTDIWVLDYVDGELKQQIHQGDNQASDFGSPTLSLSLGKHDLYFVCSMGVSPTLDTDAHKIIWSIPRDAFWKKVSKNIIPKTASTINVTLDRVSTRLRVNIEDALPAGLSKIEITPTVWYYGIDYLTGNGTDSKSDSFAISIPASYAGRTNTGVFIYGMSQDSEFTTNATLSAKDGEGGVLATETIIGAPMQRNRSTEYTGTLFLSSHSVGLSLNEEWESAWNGTW